MMVFTVTISKQGYREHFLQLYLFQTIRFISPLRLSGSLSTLEAEHALFREGD